MSEWTKEPWVVPVYVERFWSRVDKASPNGCWEWKRGATVQGYGNFHFGHSSIRAHRFSYQYYNGAIRDHDCVCHSCDNPRCVNPDHLWLGTRAENNADKEAKGRAVHPDQGSGEQNSNSVLTTPEVIALRVMARLGVPQARIANYLRVSTAATCLIVNGKRRVEETEQRVSACVNALAGIADPEKFIADARSYSHETMTAVVREREELRRDLNDARSGWESAVAETNDLVVQRDELLAAAKNYADMYLQDERDERGMCYDMQHHEDVVALFAAIAKAEGEPINGGGRPL